MKDTLQRVLVFITARLYSSTAPCVMKCVTMKLLLQHHGVESTPDGSHCSPSKVCRLFCNDKGQPLPGCVLRLAGLIRYSQQSNLMTDI